jgi:hypothetical protein
VASRPEAVAWHCWRLEKLQSPRPAAKSQPLMQNGKSRAAAGSAADIEAAQHTISAQNSLRIVPSNPLRRMTSARNQTAPDRLRQFTFAREMRGGISAAPRDQ